MTGETGMLPEISDEGVDSLLKRAIVETLVIGILASVVIWIGSGWRNAAMMAVGTAISAGSIYEWRRLARLIASKMSGPQALTGEQQAPVEGNQSPRGAGIAVAFFLFRLVIFAGLIYVSLKCFRGSAVALLCGLGLAVLSLVWEAVGLLRN
jgi:hypothetical protein